MKRSLYVGHVFVTSLICQVSLIAGHARFVEPPARSSLWRFVPGQPTNYNDNELNCGGFGHQYNNENRGRCGICGDPHDSTRPNEIGPGSIYANGVIARTYTSGDNIKATVVVTAPHRGYFEFKICPLTDSTVEATQGCLDQHLLVQPNGDTRYYFGNTAGTYTVDLLLPDGLVCEHCVFQFRYRCGNNWGRDDEGDGLGFGPQEEFRGCADVSITGSGSVGNTAGSPATATPFNTASTTARAITTTTTRDTTTTTTSSTAPPVLGPSQPRCVAVGPLATVPGMAAWCEIVCSHNPPSCPGSICSCN